MEDDDSAMQDRKRKMLLKTIEYVSENKTAFFSFFRKKSINITWEKNGCVRQTRKGDYC
jgi:hypothetical protein